MHGTSYRIMHKDFGRYALPELPNMEIFKHMMGKSWGKLSNMTVQPSRLMPATFDKHSEKAKYQQLHRSREISTAHLGAWSGTAAWQCLHICHRVTEMWQQGVAYNLLMHTVPTVCIIRISTVSAYYCVCVARQARKLGSSSSSLNFFSLPLIFYMSLSISIPELLELEWTNSMQYSSSSNLPLRLLFPRRSNAFCHSSWNSEARFAYDQCD